MKQPRLVKNFMVRIVAAVMFICVSASSALALSLDEAKQRGVVGEALNGYLSAVGPPQAEVSALVESINNQRREKYTEIAKKNGTSRAAVEALAAKKAIEATAPGNFVQAPDGSWRRK